MLVDAWAFRPEYERMCACGFLSASLPHLEKWNIESDSPVTVLRKFLATIPCNVIKAVADVTVAQCSFPKGIVMRKFVLLNIMHLVTPA